MAQGYGTAGGDIGDQGVEVEEQRPGGAADHIAEDIRAIRKRYVQPKYYDPQVLKFTANKAFKLDLTGKVVNALLITVSSGLIFGYFGDFTSNDGRAATTPHFCASAGVIPQTMQLVLPPGEYILTFQEGAAGTAEGCITPMAI